MASVESKLRDLLELAQVVLDDLPVGLLVLSSHGKPLWFNREAEVVCAVWNKTPLRKDALPMKRDDFEVPAALWAECAALLAADNVVACATTGTLLTQVKIPSNSESLPR